MTKFINTAVVVIAIIIAASCVFAVPSLAQTQTVSLTGKLVDRMCSVEDVFQLQPLADRRCTLWIETTIACPTGVCKSIYTIYCPNKAVDNRPFNSAYWTCSDPGGMQIGRVHTITAFVRTAAQQLDGYGQFVGAGFQY